MDSLKSLFDTKQYELILKLTAKSEVESDLFYRIGAFAGLGKLEDALYVIQDHQTILQNDLANLVPIHIDLLCTLGRYEQAYSALDYYCNLPYQSQVVEEILKKCKELIEKMEKNERIHILSDDEVMKALHSQNKEEVIFAIDNVKRRDIFTFLPDIVKVMTTNESQVVRSLALMLLVEKEVDRILPYQSYDGLMKVNPKTLDRPFTGERFNRLVNRMNKEFRDLTLSQNGVQILSNLVVYLYPHELPAFLDELLFAIEVTSKKYIGIEINDITLEAKNRNLDVERVNYYYNLINSALNV